MIRRLQARALGILMVAQVYIGRLANWRRR